ncbi:hypothetical protein B4N89_01270 [Embleya scabrispora]|uniref:DUF4267 domain-containing protein n=1 Tax=Embleya scabrispora TaxID=159449 RepID=A0A1T3NSI8_9ACTN|nr:hypothetical protein [Embleya scabrispora]OPC79756.1 hypothetical protein B4N89_01270 [Embleya scabrispora]
MVVVSGAISGSAGRVATVLAAGRVAAGVVSLVAPRGGVWLRPTAAREAALLGRGLGARDVLLGAGVLRALASGRGTAEWGWFAVASDLVDGAGGALEWRRLTPAERTWVGAVFALAACEAAVALSLAGADSEAARGILPVVPE